MKPLIMTGYEMRFNVITTIQSPTPAIFAFAARHDEKLIVIGDKKTPSGWECQGVSYYGPEHPETRSFKLAELLPYNHYCRKNLGYLVAMRNGADIIYETDDDNVPIDGVKFPEFCGEYDCITRDDDWVNIYQFFASSAAPNIWPRGYPLHLITRRENLDTVKKKIEVSIWQGLADNEPDVDAVYRLTCNLPYNFTNRSPVVLESGAWCPFNTQNTLFQKKAFLLLYVPSTVSFRFADILRSIVAQAILHAQGLFMGFTQASVRQERNPHDYMQDFESEIPMFLQVDKAKSLAVASASQSADMAINLREIYEALHQEGIVQKLELALVDAWIEDCAEYLNMDNC